MKTSPKKKKKQPSLYAAVVYSERNGIHSGRRDGSYSCFVDTTAKKASERALNASAAWTINTDYGPYVVLTGRLSQRATAIVRLENERI